MMPHEERALLAAGVDPHFADTYRSAYRTKYGHEPDEATLAEAIRLYTIEAKAKIKAHGEATRKELRKHAVAKREQAAQRFADEEWARRTLVNRGAMLSIRRSANAGDPEAREDLAFLLDCFTNYGMQAVTYGGSLVTFKQEIAKRAEAEREDRIVAKVTERMRAEAVVAVHDCGLGQTGVLYKSSSHGRAAQ